MKTASDITTKPKTVEEYINLFSEPQKTYLLQLRELDFKLAPNAQEVISYGIPTLKLNKIIFHYAAYDKHIGLYPTPSGVEAFAEKLKDYKISKGAIQFPLNKPLPLNLIEEIITFRIKEVGLK